ncbi:M23 family metallopeptidase [Haladaptatus caseinilyticus]|uniref:M23 family metallopeptidase n=1 Tax=Haladaptatus caseinilyticus TaxID=2993314 RepID=UPI00224A905D|nr:M23 family metallopeptidase [Haladaptatus caseinilyticus]
MGNKLTRRQILKGTGAAILGTAGVTATTNTAAAHTIGTASYTTDNLNVRSGVGTENSVVATAEKYTGMHTVDGPWNEDGYTWWEVETNGDSDNGRVRGYAVEQYQAHADFSFPATGYVSSDYGQRSSGFHGGVDIANDTGTYIYSSRAGTAYTRYEAGGCGNYIVIDHGGGYETLYCHLNDFAVSNGEYVGRHEHIGYMGSTGNSTGPHVHFEVNYNNEEQFVTGDQGEEVYAKSGMPKNYSGI